MFSRLRKVVGSGLILIGLIALIGIAGADDVAVASGYHAPIVPIILEGILFLGMMATGAVLVGGETDEDSL